MCRFQPIGLLLFFVSTLSGCCCPPVMAAREAAKRAQSTNNMHQLGIAMHRYKATEGQGWPAALDELEPYVSDQFETLMTNPVTLYYPGYDYVPPVDSPNAASAVVLYQLRNGQRDLSLDVLYGDGHVGPAPGAP